VELYLHFPNTPSWRGARLSKAQKNFTFTIVNYYYAKQIEGVISEYYFIQRKVNVLGVNV